MDLENVTICELYNDVHKKLCICFMAGTVASDYTMSRFSERCCKV
jgi:hypothetical protein